MLRLQKYIAQCGVASRRAAEELVRGGEIKVNGVVVTEMGMQIDPLTDKVEYKGEIIQPIGVHKYLVLNKPRGYISTRKDTHQRQTIYDLLPAKYDHLVSAGRLDKDTSGLLILSNDGDFIYKLTHPRFELEKEYAVLCRGKIKKDTFERLEQGVMIENRKTSPAKIAKIQSKGNNSTFFHLIIHEGRKRQIRLMCTEVGHHVLDLKRVRIGELEIGDLPEGKFRELSPAEIEVLSK